MLLGIQDLLDNPNDKSPAQREAYELFVKDKVAYRKKIKEQAARNVPDSWMLQMGFSSFITHLEHIEGDNFILFPTNKQI